MNNFGQHFVSIHTRCRDNAFQFDDFLRTIKKHVFICGFIDSTFLSRTILRELEQGFFAVIHTEYLFVIFPMTKSGIVLTGILAMQDESLPRLVGYVDRSLNHDYRSPRWHEVHQAGDGLLTL